MSEVLKLWYKARRVGVEDPRRVYHCLKVGLALTAVSLFYYMRPLYQSIASNAMWAVLTVVVVFEYTVGATLAKGLNRVAGTFVAGALAIGVHWVASHCGGTFEAAILRASVFLFASAATFSRFIPIVKERFDYGAMADFARWEPSHGQFSFRHPWNQYLKIGALTRNCAYCVEALHSCVSSEIQAHERTKKRLSNICTRLSSRSSTVLRELTVVIETMKNSSTVEFSTGRMSSAVQELQDAMKSLPMPTPTTTLLPLLVKVIPQTEITEVISTTRANTPLMEVLTLVTVTSLLVEISARIENIVDAVNELISMAGSTEPTSDENKNRKNKPIMSDDQELEDRNEMKILQRA